MGITYLDKPIQPGEELLRYMNFGYRLATGDTVASCTITGTDEEGTVVTSSLTDGPSGYSGAYVYYNLKGPAGGSGKLYHLRFVAQSTAGAIVEEDLYVPCKNL